jgi:methyl-accepting chemotaxis protein
MSSLKIRILLPVLFMSLLVMVVALGAMAVHSLGSINKQVALLGDTQAKANSVIVSIKENVSGINSLYSQHLLAISLDDLKRVELDMGQKVAHVKSLIESFRGMPAAQDEQAQITGLEDDLKRLVGNGEKFLAISRIGAKTVALDLYNGAMKGDLAGAEEILNAMVERSHQASEKALTQAEARYENTLALTGSMIVLSCILALAASFIAVKRVARPIAELQNSMTLLAAGDHGSIIPFGQRGDEIGDMSRAVEIFRTNAIERHRLEADSETNRSMTEAERHQNEQLKASQAAEIASVVEELATGLGRLAQGDTTVRIEHSFNPQFDRVRTDFNAAVAKLDDALTIVGGNAQLIKSGSMEIKDAVDQLSKRTEQQAASVEETAAALEQISTTMRDAAKRAEEAGVLVTATREGASRSSEIMRKAVGAMGAIEKSSTEISGILGLIDDIAFQTNLLALNAGVEAARAGDAGRGFAVVAQEVRELAQRSAHAAKDIKTLIASSQTHVQSGVSHVGDAGKALHEISQEVVGISQHVAAIIEASREQSIGIREISTSINEIDRGTQENAAMVEESSAATQTLAMEVNGLFALIAQFKTAGQSSGGSVDHEGSRYRAAASTRSRPYTRSSNLAA